ncbi:hypothetical protein V8J88_23410 [Massilia sp. W12]|uniref:hypothetical protein n=1 Tax=Massilia sp. W12 TaxID=3126507 RepID=UPI0030D5E348
MNFAKHMEAVFLSAALVCCSLAWAKPEQGVTEPGIASRTESASANTAVLSDAPVQTVVIVGRRQP